jgi:hypothetical protein
VIPIPRTWIDICIHKEGPCGVTTPPFPTWVSAAHTPDYAHMSTTYEYVQKVPGKCTAKGSNAYYAVGTHGYTGHLLVPRKRDCFRSAVGRSAFTPTYRATYVCSTTLKSTSDNYGIALDQGIGTLLFSQQMRSTALTTVVRMQG